MARAETGDLIMLGSGLIDRGAGCARARLAAARVTKEVNAKYMAQDKESG